MIDEYEWLESVFIFISHVVSTVHWYDDVSYEAIQLMFADKSKVKKYTNRT